MDILNQQLYENTPRVDFKPTAFDTLVYQKGYKALWQQGMLCSCYTVHTGQPDYNCPYCKGRGYVYNEGETVKVLVTSIRDSRNQDRIGLDDIGSAYLTPMSINNVGFRDRFTFLDFTTKFSEVLQPGQTQLRYPCLSMILVFCDGSYIKSEDYSISQDGMNIIWNNEEFLTKSYSVLYNIRPVFIAVNPIHEMRGTYIKEGTMGVEKFVELPKQFQIKREDFLNDFLG